MPLISIIVPVYKVEAYLNKCVDSILSQSFKDIEVILVDDGSPDKSPEVCDEYAEKDERVRVIHKENGGSSDARNAGIRAATGEYLMFIDSDDFLEEGISLNGISEKLSGNKETDVLLYGCKDLDCKTGSLTVSRTGYDIEFLESHTKDEVFKYLISSGMFPGSAWIVMTNREFVLKNNLFFEVGIKSEDIDWLLNVFLHADKFSAVNDTIYIYLKHRSGSITGTTDKKSVQDLLHIIEKWERVLDCAEYSEISPYINDYLAYHYCCTLILYNDLSREDKADVRQRIEKNKTIFKSCVTKKVRYASAICKVVGVERASRILSLYHKIK